MAENIPEIMSVEYPAPWRHTINASKVKHTAGLLSTSVKHTDPNPNTVSRGLIFKTLWNSLSFGKMMTPTLKDVVKDQWR